MKVRFKITQALLNDIHSNLERPHPFAYERVGFISAGISTVGKDLLILAREYQPVEDNDYLPDSSVGAMMGPQAINKALQWAMDGNGNALFHVHSHGGTGLPAFSGIDLRESAKFVPDFFKVAPKFAHGVIVLSSEEAIGKVWFSPKESQALIEEFSVIGAPLRKWRGQ